MFKKLLIAAVSSFGIVTSVASIDAASAWSPAEPACSTWNANGWISARACQKGFANARYGELVVQAYNRRIENIELQVTRCNITAGSITYGLNANGKHYLLGERESVTVARSVRWHLVSISGAKVVCKYDARTGFD